MIKRAFDVFVGTVGLVLMSPLLFALAAIVKYTSPGPVFYRGQRAGRHGKPFRIFKFRSMVANAEKIGGSSTSDHDPRITTIGRLMRKAKLDELPQLINVIRGEMTLVGPRPEVQQYVDQFTLEEQAILKIRPGITDWASIWNHDEGAVLAGSADPDKAYEELIRPTKLKLQLVYARNHSFWIDLKIILYTLLKLFHRRFIPKEISRETDALNATIATTAETSRGVDRGYATVTELPGHGATREQLSMLHTRYRFAAELSKNKDVLELACGPGVALGYLKTVARSVIGGDVDEGLVQAARRHYGPRVEVRRLDAEKIPFDDQSFDVILLLEAIYYLPDASKFMSEARRVLRRDGVVMICTANRERLDFNPSPFSHVYYSAAELRDLLAAEGFSVDLYGGYPVSASRWRDRILTLLRRVAVKWRMIPKTMAWKIRLKRLLFGKLKEIPAELTVREVECKSVVRINASRPVRDFKVIYAVGHRAA